jgi:glycosyltransferase involved in cell wall biosynthesis
MSDVMPYESTRFSEMTPAMVDTYRERWRAHLESVRDVFSPDVIHVHHIWLLASLVRDVFPDAPIVNHCHATGLRQMQLAPHLAEDVVRGCRRNDRFAVLHGAHQEALAAALDVPRSRIHIVGAGYREETFHPPESPRPMDKRRILYAGKLSHAKGLPWLLDAFERVAASVEDVVLEIAGSGGGSEAAALAERIQSLAPRVVGLGHVDQETLADRMRAAEIFVLPSFYEGLPLVLVEAHACGARVISTDLAGVRAELAPPLGDALICVDLPRIHGPDTPEPADLPAFVDRLEGALMQALALPPPTVDPARLAPFTWRAVHARVAQIWSELLG